MTRHGFVHRRLKCATYSHQILSEPWPHQLGRCPLNRKRLVVTFAAIQLAAGIALSATPAHADWRRGYGHRGYGWGGYGWGGYHHHRGRVVGPAIVGGALLGLGVGALLAAPYAAPPPAVYAPPPAYYPPPAYTYYPPPAYAYYPPY